MKEFDKNYILDILIALKDILTDPDQNALLVTTYTQNDPSNQRYQLGCITNGHQWTDKEKLYFSVAYSEASTKVSEKIQLDTPEAVNKPKNIHRILTKFTKTYIPRITDTSGHSNRLQATISNINQLMTEINAGLTTADVDDEESSEDNVSKVTNISSNNNSLLFFSIAIASAGAVAAASYALK
jgi:hypothetical protein